MKTSIQSARAILRGARQAASNAWLRITVTCAGALALLWFLVRVIPKPSRASYPCQRAAFPIASGFVVWLCGFLAIKLSADRIRRLVPSRAAVCIAAVTVLGIAGWSLLMARQSGLAAPAPKVIDFNFIPEKSNTPRGLARGIFPGRVVWARDPLATKWAGNWKQESDQWWLDKNTDQARVDTLLSATLLKLTGAEDGEQAWKLIFEYYNRRARQMEHRGYQPGEVVAVKINCNNSSSGKSDNYTDATPQTVLAMVRQLVKKGHVRPEDILIYDARRYIPPYILTKVWSEFKDVRFLQQPPPKGDQPKHPVYGDYSRLEAADWVHGIDYSNGRYKDAKLIPKQVFNATYLVNLALLKAHSYAQTAKDTGDEGQTAVTMCGKNHFGSIKGTPELHPAIDTNQEAVKNAYSPMVDLAASPHLGAKTILYVLDGLYSGRKWRTYPVHFPNPPFNNRVEPYENPDWPASILASLDGVALDSVGLDILFAQTKNNTGEDGRPRILIRANASDYLLEMAEADHPPSGTVYMQDGKRVTSLGVQEHWDSDATKRYSRNLDPVNGKGIELIYLPMQSSDISNSKAASATPCMDQISRFTAPGVPAMGPAETASPIGKWTTAPTPADLPGKGLAQHPMLYVGENYSKMFLVQDGRVIWAYQTGPGWEYDDVWMLSNGNILFTRMQYVAEITPEKKVVWRYDCNDSKDDTHTEVHTCQPIGLDKVMFVVNGLPPRLMIVNIKTGVVEVNHEVPSAEGQPFNPKNIHGQFRRARYTAQGTYLLSYLSQNKVVELSKDFKKIWSYSIQSPWAAVRLKNGNTLITDERESLTREVNQKGETVWECSQADLPEAYRFSSPPQTCTRLANGNTIFCSRGNANGTGPQLVEVSPDKKVVWVLQDWHDLGGATAVQILDDSGVPESPGESEH